MAHKNINTIIKKNSNTLTKVEHDGNVTIYENNQPIAEIRSANYPPAAGTKDKLPNKTEE